MRNLENVILEQPSRMQLQRWIMSFLLTKSRRDNVESTCTNAIEWKLLILFQAKKVPFFLQKIPFFPFFYRYKWIFLVQFWLSATCYQNTSFVTFLWTFSVFCGDVRHKNPSFFVEKEKLCYKMEVAWYPSPSWKN